MISWRLHQIWGCVLSMNFVPCIGRIFPFYCWFALFLFVLCRCQFAGAFVHWKQSPGWGWGWEGVISAQPPVTTSYAGCSWSSLELCVFQAFCLVTCVTTTTCPQKYPSSSSLITLWFRSGHFTTYAHLSCKSNSHSCYNSLSC